MQQQTMALVGVVSCLLVCLAAQVSAVPPVLDAFSNSKVFGYNGELPIKDESEIDKPRAINDTNQLPEVSTMRPEEQAAAEQACWNMINDQSVVTFALQNKVLDKLAEELNNSSMNAELKNSIDRITKNMKNNMNEASEALKHDAADEFFDSLFEASEDIITMSNLLRDPKLDDDSFLVLVKAVSMLGRNNAQLISEFTEMCSFGHRSPRPRFGRAE